MNATSPATTPALIPDAARFLRRPDVQPLAVSAPGKASRMVRAWSIAFLMAVPLGCIVALFTAIFGRSMSQHAVFELLEKSSPLATFVLAAIGAPIVEECAFRLGLRPTRFNLAVGGAFFTYFMAQVVLNLLPDGSVPEGSLKMSNAAGLAMIAALVTAVALVLWFLIPRIGLERIQAFYGRRFGWLFYGSAVIFALMHTFNFEDMGWIVLAAPLLTLPQLVLGLMLGYVRTRLGMVWAVLAHSLNNSVALVPSLLLVSLAPDVLNTVLQPGMAGAGRLSQSQSLAVMAVSFGFMTLLFVVFTAAVWSLLEWARGRSGKRNYALVSTLFNVLEPGIGQFYNDQRVKGATLFGLFVAVFLCSGLSLLIPAATSAPLIGVLLFFAASGAYLLVLCIAIVDSLIVGSRLDRAEAVPPATA